MLALCICALQAQLIKPVVLTIVGGAAVQDSLDVKLAKKDTTGNVGATYWTASKAVADTTFKKNQLATKVAKADTTTEAGGSYFTATQAKTDSTNRNVLIDKKVAKVDTTTEAVEVMSLRRNSKPIRPTEPLNLQRWYSVKLPQARTTASKSRYPA